MYSDTSTLYYVLSSARLNATIYRWVAELADFHLTIRYHPCQETVDADWLSRMPVNIETAMWEWGTFRQSVGATIKAVELQHDPPLTLVCQGALACREIKDEHYKSLSKEEIQEAQRDNKNVREIMDCLFL